jgi:hypothetical protein
MISRGFDEHPQLLQQRRAEDLIRPIAFCPQALRNFIDGAAFARSAS